MCNIELAGYRGVERPPIPLVADSKTHNIVRTELDFMTRNTASRYLALSFGNTPILYIKFMTSSHIDIP